MPRILPDLRPETLKPDVRRWTGISAITAAVLTIAEFLVQTTTIGTRPELDDEAALGPFTAETANATLTVIFIDTFLMAALVVFLASFRQLITHTRHDMQWIADLSFGAGLVFVAITLVGDAMDAGTALDTIGATPDPSAIRALTEGHLVMFGSIGCVLTALVVAAAGYVSFASGALPRWTAWVAWACAAANVAVVPSMFGGTSASAPFSSGGPGVTAFATFPFLVWVTIAGLVTIRGHAHHLRRLEARRARGAASAA